MAIFDELFERANNYAFRRKMKLVDQLGNGTDGAVWRTSKNSAVKALVDSTKYATKLRCYQRLKERGVGEISGVHVPVLVDTDSELLIIEIDIVEPPFIVDFGKAYIDEPSPYTPEQLAASQREWSRFFPKRDLPLIRKLLSSLKGIGIEYMDPKPNNITLHHGSEVIDDAEYLDFEQGCE